MGAQKKFPETGAMGNPLPALNRQQKESLLMMIVVNFAGEQGLLNHEQLEDARASLRSLFIRTTGEETMLRKLIGILRINRSLNQAFNDMTHILEGVIKSRASLESKHEILKEKLKAMDITVDENNDFIGILLEFSKDFIQNVAAFERQMLEYQEVRENEARTTHIFRLAREARKRLKNKFEQADAEDNKHETEVKKKIYQSFNYADAESEYKYAKKSAASAGKEIESSLKQFHKMCQMTMKPEMRTPSKIELGSAGKSCPDIYTFSARGLADHPRLKFLAPVVQELLQLYQHSFGMFMLDFEKFNRAIVPMIENTEDYFNAKENDEDARTNQVKLKQIESLIAFIEAISLLLKDGGQYSYPAFSTQVTKLITDTNETKWIFISEELLRMKLAVEAKLSTQLT